MIYINFELHAYQPPTQLSKVLAEIYDTSYKPVIKLIENHKNISISLDITKSLFEKLPEEFAKRIKSLFFKKQIELINTSAYHYLLPLMPERVTKRQLALNKESLWTYFGAIPTGLFPPELAFFPPLASIAKETGHDWLMADDELFVQRKIHLPEEKRTPQSWIPLLHDCGIMLRSRKWSNRVSFGQYKNGADFADELIEGQKQWQKKLNNSSDSYIILAIDFETFGHHPPKDSIERFFLPFFAEIIKREKECKISPLNFIFNHFPKYQISEWEMPSGSWSTDDLNNPFPLWNHPDNRFHQLWNEFINIVFAVTSEKTDPELQSLLDKAFYSCTPWQFARNEKGIASWCLPLFLRIIELLYAKDKNSLLFGILLARLRDIYAEMKELTKT